MDRATAELDTLHRHTDMDLVIQKFLGVMFVVAGVVLLAVAAWRAVEEGSRPAAAADDDDVVRIALHTAVYEAEGLIRAQRSGANPGRRVPRAGSSAA